MNARQAAIVELASQELEDMIQALEQHGVAYAASYVGWLTTGKTKRNYPFPPAALRPELAKAVREAALDSALVERLS